MVRNENWTLKDIQDRASRPIPERDRAWHQRLIYGVPGRPSGSADGLPGPQGLNGPAGKLDGQ